MNKKIKNLNLESLLFFDAEFASRNEELEVDSREFDLWQWDNRDKVTDYFLSDKELCDLYKRKAALKPVFNRIICISVGFISANTFYYKNIVGEEKEIIEEFYSMLNRGNYTPVSYNGIGYDMPNIRLKYFQNEGSMTLLDRFSDSDKKPWEVTDNHIDLMGISKGTLFYNLSLDGMCYLANVDSPKDDLKGSEVSAEYYKNGVEEKIAPYCAKDTIAVAQLFLKMAGKLDVIEHYVDKSNAKPVKQEPINVLDHILSSGELSTKTVNAIVEFADKEELNKEDVLVLVRAALSNSKEKVEEEDYQELKTALLLDVNYSKIQIVVDKGNLAKLQANALIKQYKDSSEEEKKQVISLVEKFLIEKDKLGQVTAKNSLLFLKENL